MFKSLWVCLASAWIGGCAHGLREGIDRDLSSWIGQPADSLVEAWGAPRSTYTMDSGSKVLTYEETSFVNRTATPYYFYPRTDITSYSDSCKINFFTDKSQKILSSYSYVGSSGVCRDIIDSGSAVRRSAPSPAPSSSP